MSTQTEEKPVSLNAVLIAEEKDPEMKQALEYLDRGGEQQVQLEARDVAKNANATEDVVLPGKDAVDYSDIKLTEEEEKMEVVTVPVKVTAPTEQDTMDFDAPEEDKTGPVEIDKSTLKNLLREVNGQAFYRHSELYLLANLAKIDEWASQQNPARFNVIAQRLTFSPDDKVSFEKIPGGANPDDAPHADEPDQDEVAVLPAWDSSRFAFPLVVSEPVARDLIDQFDLTPSQAKTLRAQNRLKARLLGITPSPSPVASPSGMVISPVANHSSSMDEDVKEVNKVVVDGKLAVDPMELLTRLRSATPYSYDSPLPVRPESLGHSSDAEDDAETLPDYDVLSHPVQHVQWENDIIWDLVDPAEDLPIIGNSSSINAEATHPGDVSTPNQTTSLVTSGSIGGDTVRMEGMMEDSMDGTTSDSESGESENTSDMKGAVTETASTSEGASSLASSGHRVLSSRLLTSEPSEDEILVESIYRPPKALLLPSTTKIVGFQDENEPSSSDLTQDVVVSLPNRLVASQFPVYNRRLDEADWMDRVVWDDDDLSQLHQLAPPGSKVEVDMTDVHILFEEEGVFHYEEMHRPDSTSAAASSTPAKKAIRKRHLQLRSKTTDLIRTKLDALNQIDKFNLSHDAYYMDGLQAKAREKKNVKLLHSPYAMRNILLRKSLSLKQYMNFHRPRLYMFLGVKHVIVPANVLQGKKKKSRGLEVMKHRRDLSAREGRVVLFEYSEEFPPALHDIGMASRIANYRRNVEKRKEETPALAFVGDQPNAPRPEDTPTNIVTDDALPREDGEEIILEENVDLPFLGDIVAGAQLQAVHNNLFRAPIFRHLPDDSDFMLIRMHPNVDTSIMEKPRRGNQNHFSAEQQQILTTFYVREIPALYLVGQQEPEQVVPTPGSRTDNEYVKTRLEQFVYYLLSMARAQTGKAEVKLSMVHDYFPRTETATRKVLRKFTIFDRSGEGTWTFASTESRPTLPTDAEIEAMTTLDDACLFDCQQAVVNRLRSSGVPAADIANIHRHVKTLYDRKDPRYHVARFIAEELELAAWNLTSNFIDSAHSKSILQLRGLGDPSGQGQAYSYLRLPMKIANLKRDKEREAGVIVTGTESDLRSLTLPQLNALLRQAGVSEEVIAVLRRWPKVHLLREIADNRKKQEADDSNINKFARYSKHNVATHQDQYNERIQQIFSSQIQALKFNPRADEDEEEGSGLDLTFGASSDDMPGVEETANTPEAKAEKKIRDESEAYLRFVASLETTSTKQDEPGAPTQPSTPSGAGGSSTVTRIEDDVIVLDPNTGLPTKPGKYAKITTTNASGIEKVIWSLEPAKVQQAKDASSASMKKQAKASAAKRKTDGAPAKLTTKCGRCGQVGHNRNSPACPKFNDIIDDDDGYGRKKKGGSKKKAKSDTEEEEEEIIEEEWDDSGDETPEEDFADDVGIAAQRYANQPKTEVVAAGGKVVIKGLNTNRRRAASSAKRKRTDFLMDYGDDDEDDDFDMYDDEAPPPPKRPVKPRVKADSPQGEFNTLLRPSLDAVISRKEFEVFKPRVDKRYVPDYYDVVKEPMYMDLINTRLRSFHYTTVAQYMADWQLLKENCYAYNTTRYPDMLVIVDDLFSRVKSTVDAIGEDRLALLEGAVAQQVQQEAASAGTPAAQ